MIGLERLCIRICYFMSIPRYRITYLDWNSECECSSFSKFTFSPDLTMM